MQEENKDKSAEQFDSGLIFAGPLALMKSRYVKVTQILNYELALGPTSMFEKKTRDVHMAKSMSTLKNRLQVAQSAHATRPDAIAIDGCAILWLLIAQARVVCKILSQT